MKQRIGLFLHKLSINPNQKFAILCPAIVHIKCTNILKLVSHPVLKKKLGQSPEKNIKLREFSLAHAYGLCIHRTETLVDELKAVTLVKVCGASGEAFWLLFSVGLFFIWCLGSWSFFGVWELGVLREGG